MPWLRKARGLTRKALAELVDLSLQIHGYEAGSAKPTLDGIRKLARPPRVSADSLVFEQDECGPDEEFRLQFEAFTHFDRDEASRLLADFVQSIPATSSPFAAACSEADLLHVTEDPSRGISCRS